MNVRESHGDERGANDEKIEQVESRPAERAVVNDEAVRDHLETDFDREDGGEEVVEVVEYLQHKGSFLPVTSLQLLPKDINRSFAGISTGWISQGRD